MLANLLGVAGVKHVITVDLHASQMQGFFRCPVDNLHAEPIIAKWIKRNVDQWREAVVVSKNAGGTKRVTSLADALKLNFGMVTTDRKRGGVDAVTGSMMLRHLDGKAYHRAYETSASGSNVNQMDPPQEPVVSEKTPVMRSARIIADSQGSPTQTAPRARGSETTGSSSPQVISTTPPLLPTEPEVNGDGEVDDHRPREVIRGRLVQGHIVEEDFPSPTKSSATNSIHEDDPMVMSHMSHVSHHSSIFVPERQALGGSGDAANSSDDEDNQLEDPEVEHLITLVGDVRNRPVLIVDDMIDKPGSWIAAAETVVKRGGAKKVYCIATHGVFGADCLAELQACECIDTIVVTNSFPIPEDRARACPKLRILDLSFMLAEAIRRNHFGESLSPLFQHYD